MRHMLDTWGLLAAEAAKEAPEAGSTSAWVVYAIPLAVLVLPFVLGGLLARVLKLQDLSARLGVALFAGVLGLTPFMLAISGGDGEQDVVERLKGAIRLGIDLKGGTNLVFQAESDNPDKPITDQVMQKMVSAVGRRVNPSGTEEVVVRKVGTDRIEVIIPGADEERVRQVKKLITKLGSLEFAILANQRDHAAQISSARQLSPEENDLRDNKNEVIASWRHVGLKAGPDGRPVPKSVGADGVATRPVKREIKRGNKVETIDTVQFLVILDPEDQRVTGQYLTRAGETMDESGRLAVSFNFDTKGAYLFQGLTSSNRPRKDGTERRLAILLDNQIHSAPGIRDTIGARGIITGEFDRAEINELVGVLNAGALEVPLNSDPISEFSVSPLIGDDVIKKGFWAFQVSGIVVLLFMAGYYLWIGLIADVCLLFNLVMVMGTMALIDATFTLPGLAGIVLTIGMAVDANVLIFERIREERARNSSVRMAIQNGFGKAFTTIVDANLTTLITAVVLYYIGTDQVKGFAVTLFIGIVMSMFSALFVGRLIFDIVERKRWLRELRMFSLIGATSVNFVGQRKIAAVVSSVLIVLGIATFVSRGDDNLDIDFTGGTMITFQLTEPATTEEVRKVLESEPKFGTSLTLERLALQGEEASDAKGRYFRMRTTMRDSKSGSDGSDSQTATDDESSVATLVNSAFDGSSLVLRKVKMVTGKITTIDPAETKSEDATAEKDADAEAEATADKDPFAGGHQVKLTFEAVGEGDGELTKLSILDYLTTALEQITTGEGNVPRYPDAGGLLKLTPLAGSGMGKAGVEGVVRKYSQVEVASVSRVAKADLETALQQMAERMDESPVFDEVNTFASSVASEMRVSAVVAMLASLVAIVAYIWLRFQRVTFGLAAVVALVHDVLVVLGMVALGATVSGTSLGPLLALVDFKINLAMIAAFLTIVGYSLNDTIVVFDRIREVRGKNPALTEDMVNNSLNQTLSRTLLTSLTTLLVVGILYVFGGEGIHGFAFCLVMGVLVGTYSSVYVASPTLLWLMNRSSQTQAVQRGGKAVTA